MKKTLFLLILALFLSLGVPAWAEEGIEVVVEDGASVVAVDVGVYAPAGFFGKEDFVLPSSLITIEDSAFEGIDASRVEISENVASIGSHAFAKCKNLREFHISASVKEIDKDALEGCENVTVYGSTDVAKAFAEAAGFDYVDLNAAEPPVVRPVGREEPPVALPFVKR